MKRPGADKPHMKRARRPQLQPNLRPTTGQYDGKQRGSANHVRQEPTRALRGHAFDKWNQGAATAYHEMR
eukprot:14233038-Alexandrium_andersonii.AAC.1